MGNSTNLKLAPANVYMWEGSPGAWVDLGFVDVVTLTLTRDRATLRAGQTGTSDQDKVVTGAHAKLEFMVQEITLENMQRALLGNTQSFVDDTTPAKRKLEFQSRAGQSLRALGKRVKVVPIVGGAETTNIEHIFEIPIGISGDDDIQVKFDAVNQIMYKVTIDGLVDSTKRDRLVVWGDDTTVDTVTPFGF